MTDLDTHIARFASKVGVKAACNAFGTAERSYHYRRQRAEGRLVVPPPAEPKERRPHPASLTAAEKDLIIETLCSERFVDLETLIAAAGLLAAAQVY